MLKKIEIRNYRLFREFRLDFNPGANVLVGDNDSGKSTILEAINLALTGRVRGKAFGQALSPYHFNLDVTAEYARSVKSGARPAPPEIVIDLYLHDTDDVARFRGSNNLTNEDEVGVRVRAFLNPEFADEYGGYLNEAGDVLRLVPTEYFTVEWKGFSGTPISPRSLPGAASLIDASSIRLATGADYYMQQIIKGYLSEAERVELTRSYRTIREIFSGQEPVQRINQELQGVRGEVSSKQLALAIDISERHSWEENLTPHLDEVPLQQVGNGEQSVLKVLLAIARRVETSSAILIEEPENHLSFSSMNMLIRKIEEKCSERQVVITTHSSFVLNKLGLDSLILVGREGGTRLRDLTTETQQYFKKLSGYDTLRVVLAKRLILVEGPSDELVLQRAYRDVVGQLPINDGVDVLNVRGLSFKRYLEIAVPLGRRTSVVTDNDGYSPEEVESRYAEYAQAGVVSIHVGKGDPRTLEPQICAANSLETLNRVFASSFDSVPEAEAWMIADKTRSALAIFESDSRIELPVYIREAIDAIK